MSCNALHCTPLYRAALNSTETVLSLSLTPQKLEELSDFNKRQMEQVYSNAIERAAEEIDQCAAAHAVVKKIVKR